MKHYFEESKHGLENPEDFEERVRMDEYRIGRIIQKLEADHHVTVLDVALAHFDNGTKTNGVKVISRKRK